MARARAIDMRLERLVPAMEEYFVKGIFTKQQLQEIATERRNHEYKLVARPLLYVDVKRAIDFEMELEARINSYLAGSEMQLKHRNDVIERIAHIFQIAIPCLEANITSGGATSAGAVAVTSLLNVAARERDLLERQYLTFLRDFGRENELSRYLAGSLQRAPGNVAPWVFSVEWELQKGNADNARSIAQEALKHIAADPRAWVALLRVETGFVNQITRGVLETDSLVKKKRDRQSKKKESNDTGAADEKERDDADDDDQQELTTTVSQRFAATNPPLAKVVLDGELVVSSARAAAQSKALGVPLLEEVTKALIVAADDNGSSNSNRKRSAQPGSLQVTGKFFSRFFCDCVETALPNNNVAADNEDASTNGNIPKISTVAASAIAERRSLAVSAVVSLITCPWRYFGFSIEAARGGGGGGNKPAAKKTEKKNSAEEQQQNVTASGALNKCWDPTSYLDSDLAAAAASNNVPACNYACLAAAALQTLSALVAVCRRTCHPAAAKAALCFAEELVTAMSELEPDHPLQLQHGLTVERVAAIITGDSDNRQGEQRSADDNGSNDGNEGDGGFSSGSRTSSCARCSAALAESLSTARRFLATGRLESAKSKAPVSGAAAAEFPWASWVSPAFAQILTDHHFVVSALVPAAGADSDASGLEMRVRRLLQQCGGGGSGALNNSGAQLLLRDLDSWFQSELASSKKNTKQQTLLLLGSETVAEQVCTLLIARAVLCSRLAGSVNLNDGGRRRQRGSSDDDDDGNEDDITKRSPFFEIVHLYKKTIPSTPKQIEIRSKCMSVIACAWIEQATSCNVKPSFPFVARDFLLPSAASGADGGIAFSDEKTVSVLRGIIDQCASVLPASIHLVVHIGAAVEFRVQKELLKKNKKKQQQQQMQSAAEDSQHGSLISTAQTRMRRFFETAVAQQARHRPTWAAWKQCETNLGNLQMAASVQRRAATVLADSRLQL